MVEGVSEEVMGGRRLSSISIGVMLREVLEYEEDEEDEEDEEEEDVMDTQ